MVELSERLKLSEQQRDLIQRKLNEALDDKERTQRRLDSIGAAHESRITEMHCVIVELNKKLKFQQENAILEDQEPDGSRSGKIRSIDNYRTHFFIQSKMSINVNLLVSSMLNNSE